MGTCIFCAALSQAAQPPSTNDLQELARANALVQAGRPDQALPIYRKLAAANPNELAIRTNLAVALYKSERYRETVDECNRLVQRQANLFPAWLFLGASRLKLGDSVGAEQPLRKALTLQPNDPNAHIMMGDVLFAEEKYREAAEQYQPVAQAIPNQPRVWFDLGRTYELLARNRLAQLNRDGPGLPETLALSAQFEFDAAQLVQAFHNLRQALAEAPSFRDLHFQIAAIYTATGHTDWALEEKRKVREGLNCLAASVECDFVAGRLHEAAWALADTPQALYWQGRALLDLTRQAYAKLQELPPSRESHEAAALGYEKRGMYPEAVTQWKEALKTDPQDSGLKRHLALALCHSNDCGSALSLLRREVQRTPSSTELNYLYGLALVELRSPADAIPYLEAAVRQDSHFLVAHGALGEAYLESGKPQQAIPELQAAIGADPGGARHYQLARAYQQAGMRDEASHVLREYQELRQSNPQRNNDLALTPP